MVFAKRLVSDGHTREFVVDNPNDNGWEVREAEDNQVVKRSWLHDWHRVESAMMRFAIQTTELQSAGWEED